MNLAIAGGGTGGHLFPGLALAEALRERAGRHSVVFFGSRRGIESRVVPPAGFDLVAHDLEGMRGRGLLAPLRASAKMLRAALAVRAEMSARRIDVMVGLGGYASAAGVIGARLAGVPVILLEQNRRPGLSNRSLARFSSAVCTSFADSARYFPASKVRHTGNPLRSAVERSAGAGERDALLVFGGSAGARSLNRAVLAALPRLAASGELPPVVHQCGAADLDEVREAYRRAGLAARVEPFIEDMAAAYARARLAVCRAGATTVAELVASGTPSVLLPFPFAAGDHQRDNARALAEAGAAVVVDDDGQAGVRLTEVLSRLLRSRETLDSMGSCAAKLARPGAAERVLSVIEQIVEGKP